MTITIDSGKESNVASRGPAKLFKVAGGQLGDEDREHDFSGTEETFASVRVYVKLALSLPVDKQRIRTALGEDFAMGGLGVDDFYCAFTTISQHAAKWAELERGVLLIGGGLEKFSAKLEPQARLLDGHIAEMEQRQSIAAPLDPLAEAAAQESAKSKLAATVSEITDRIETMVEHGAGLKGELDDFRGELKNDILQKLCQKFVLSTPALNGETAKILLKQIRLTHQEINDLNEEVLALVAKGWELYRSGGTKPVKACLRSIDDTKERSRSAQARLTALTGEYIALQDTTPSLRELALQISQLEHAMFYADIGLTQVLDVWNATLTWGRNSISAFETDLNLEKLRILRLELKAITSPWVEIGKLLRE